MAITSSSVQSTGNPIKIEGFCRPLYLQKIAVKLTQLTQPQADCLGGPIDSPFKSEHYRY
jgi:adenosylhomocysteinase